MTNSFQGEALSAQVKEEEINMSNNSTNITLTLLKPNTFYRLHFAISLFDSMYNRIRCVKSDQ